MERDTPGLRTSEAIAKLGLKGSPVGELVLDGCEVPATNVIGKPGSGFFVLDHVMKWEILLSFITSAGAMAQRLERCVEYARTREQFGKPIGGFQAIAHKIVDMKIAVETSRRWLYDAARKFAGGRGHDRRHRDRQARHQRGQRRAPRSPPCRSSARAATPPRPAIEAGLRDAVGGTIYSGTSEIQRNRIAATLGLRETAR